MSLLKRLLRRLNSGFMSVVRNQKATGEKRPWHNSKILCTSMQAPWRNRTEQVAERMCLFVL